jgi:hypothetical protein
MTGMGSMQSNKDLYKELKADSLALDLLDS